MKQARWGRLVRETFNLASRSLLVTDLSLTVRPKGVWRARMSNVQGSSLSHESFRGHGGHGDMGSYPSAATTRVLKRRERHNEDTFEYRLAFKNRDARQQHEGRKTRVYTRNITRRALSDCSVTGQLSWGMNIRCMIDRSIQFAWRCRCH